jgi:hypothetical protein
VLERLQGKAPEGAAPEAQPKPVNLTAVDEMPSIKLLNQILADLEATSKQAAADVLR